MRATIDPFLSHDRQRRGLSIFLVCCRRGQHAASMATRDGPQNLSPLSDRVSRIHVAKARWACLPGLTSPRAFAQPNASLLTKEVLDALSLANKNPVLRGF
jgi:hypothetical protein